VEEKQTLKVFLLGAAPAAAVLLPPTTDLSFLLS